jgi:hypothetical protein
MTKHMQVKPVQEKRERSPLGIRRVDVIPVALPLVKPMPMAGQSLSGGDDPA